MAKKGPGNFNIITIGLVAAVVGLVWAGVRWGPSFAKERDIVTVVRDTSADLFVKNRAGKLSVGDEQQKLTAAVRETGATNVDVEIRVDTATNELVVRTSYEFALNYPTGVRMGQVEERTGTERITYD